MAGESTEILEVKEVDNSTKKERYFQERRFDELPFAQMSRRYIHDANEQKVNAQTRKYWMKELERELLDRVLGRLGLGSTADHLEEDVPYPDRWSISSSSSYASSSLTEVSSLGSSVSMESFDSKWSYGSKTKDPFYGIIEKLYSTADERYNILRIASMDSVISTSSEEEEGFLGYMMAAEDRLEKFGQYGIHRDFSTARIPSVVIHSDMQIRQNGMNKTTATDSAFGIASVKETKVGKKKKNKKKHGILRRLYEFFCICSGPVAVEDAHKANEDLHD